MKAETKVNLEFLYENLKSSLCLSGQKEFNRNLAILEKYLVALQLNKSLEPFDPPTSNITQKPPRHPILPNARRSRSISPKQTPSSSNSSSSNFVINQEQQAYEQDYLDHRNVDDQYLNDGQGNIDPIRKLDHNRMMLDLKGVQEVGLEKAPIIRN
jgi:hypothetical protein